MEHAPLRWTAGEAAKQVFLLAAWIALLALLLIYLPNRIWDQGAGTMVFSLGAIAAWRYGWWALHFARSQIYSRLVFPRIRRRADALWRSGWRPRMLHFMVTTFREKPSAWISSIRYLYIRRALRNSRQLKDRHSIYQTADHLSDIQRCISRTSGSISRPMPSQDNS